MSRFDSSAGPGPVSTHTAFAPNAHDDRPVCEEAIFLEHRAALDATLFANAARDEFVFELEAGRLRPQP